MKIGLIDVDSHNFPNLSLMKISAYEQSKGNEVEWSNGFVHYDRVYMAKVFDETYSKDYEYVVNADEVIKGGTGYNNSFLPNEIEHMFPDYSLYGVQEAYGYLTRGCPRHCPFCIVGDKEGLVSHTVAEIGEFYRGGQKKIVLLDPNITASKDCEKHFQTLIETKVPIDFTQGLDIRLMDKTRAEMLNKMKLDMVHFAWDNYEMKTYEILKKLRPYFKWDFRRMRVYVLTNFNTTFEQDLERVMKLRELNYDPYIMIYNKPSAPKKIRHLARWVNNKFVFRSTERFADYKPKNLKIEVTILQE